MKVLLVTRANGRIQSKRTISGDWLRVGRNASCEVHLPDPRVALEQGMITKPDEDFRYVEGESGLQNITRKGVHQVRLRRGDAISIGPYRLELQPPPSADYDATLQLELVHPREATGDLSSTRASKFWLPSTW